MMSLINVLYSHVVVDGGEEKRLRVTEGTDL